MSVLRGFDLLRSRNNATANSRRFRFITLILLFGLLGAIGLSTQLNWSGAAALRSSDEANSNNVSTTTTKSVAAKVRGAAARVGAASNEPAQGCTVNCGATVPATGQAGAAVNFNSTATTAGCATPPSFDWNFGDGTPRSGDQNTTHAYASGGTYTWTLTVSAGSGAAAIETVAGGLGEGNQARQAPFGVPTAIARDPQGRGIYVADFIDRNTLIRFINTSNAPVTIAGRTIAPGVVRAVAGGGADTGENVPGAQADLGTVTGLATSPNGDLVYFLGQSDGQLRALNVSSNAVTVGGASIATGNVGTLAGGLSAGPNSINGLAVSPTTGDVYFADATAGINRVFRVSSSGTVTAIAGNGATTAADAPFSPGAALNTPLLQLRAVEVDSAGNVLITDTGHGRVIRVDAGGNATLVHQFTFNAQNPNPYPSGVAIQGGNIYSANGNQQTVTRLTNGVLTVAGTAGTACDYSVSNCGDGGPGVSAGLNMLSSTSTSPLAGIEGDNAGLFILDQGTTGRGRVRYLNLSGGSVNVAGVTIAPGAIDTIGGNGLTPPYDGGLATSATFNTPVGVAVDANGNLWVADTNSARLRFVNRGSSEIVIFNGTSSAQTVPAGGIVTVNKNVGGGGATDGVPVIQAGFDSPQGLFSTPQGLFVVDAKGGPNVPMSASGRRTSLIRFVNTSGAPVTFYSGSANPVTVNPGFIAKIAGGGESAATGDGGFAQAAKFVGASDVVVDGNGNIYVADTGQNAVRRINGSTGIVNSLSLPAKQYTGVGLDASGQLYIANFTDGTVLRENGAGNGTFSTLASGLNKPRDVAVAADGSAYVTVGPAANQAGNHQIVQVSPAGAVTVVAGSAPGFAGDGGPAVNAQINISPSPLVVGSGATNQIPQLVGIIIGPAGDVFFTDSNNNRVRRISAGATICTRTGTITIAGDNPVPQLTSLDPNSRLAGSGAFALTINGSGFVPLSKVFFNGQERPTTFVSNTQIMAQIPANDVINAGTASITVVNPAPGGGTSNALTFTITAPNPVPNITGLSPNSAVEGSGAFTLTVNGTGFVPGSVVRWDGSPRATTFVSATQLTAQILASDLVGVGQASVSVVNPAPGGGTSNVVTFNITSGQNPAPVLTSVTPNSVTAGGQEFALNITGANFVASSRVRFNGQELPTAFVSGTQLTAQVAASLIATAGTAQITVFTPTPGGGVSAPLTLTINPQQQGNPIPSISSVTPNVVTTGGQGFTVAVNGLNFVNGAVVRVNGNDRPTTLVSSTQLTATILPGDVAAAGTLNIAVFNPAPGGGLSNVVPLTVVTPLASISAASFTAGVAPESIVAGFGLNLATGVELATTIPLPTTLLGTRVSVRDSQGTERFAPLFFVAPTQVNYLVPAGTAEGTATVTVTSNNNVVGLGQLSVANVAPALFSANANGAGVAAAVLVRVKADGTQIFEPVARVEGGVLVPIPIDLGPEGELVIPILYGTGFRNRSNPTSTAGVSLTIGGVNVPVDYASVAPGFVGLDQVNAGTIPRSLIGRGLVNIILTVDGRTANTVQVSIR